MTAGDAVDFEEAGCAGGAVRLGGLAGAVGISNVCGDREPADWELAGEAGGGTTDGGNWDVDALFPVIEVRMIFVDTVMVGFL